MEDFNYDDFNWDMVQSENRFFAYYMAEKIPVELTFLDGEVINGRIKWYDELNIGVINNKGREVYIDKRALKWLKAL